MCSAPPNSCSTLGMVSGISIGCVGCPVSHNTVAMAFGSLIGHQDTDTMELAEAHPGCGFSFKDLGNSIPAVSSVCFVVTLT